MSEENQEKLSLWKTWLIKKLLSSDSSKDEILNLIANDDTSEDQVSKFDDNNEKSLIKNILQLESKSVEDVMVPRGEIISVENKQNYKEVFQVIKEESHSRLPVYENNLDNIIGFFHVKDFIKIKESNFDLNLILRDVLYVAPKSPILDLLKRMRLSRIHIALVVDGIGGVDGLVTIEDLVEEIVGEIEDEHDGEDIDDEIIKKEENLLVVSASYSIDELEADFNINLKVADEEEIETVGGLVFSKINRIPKINEEFNIDDIVNIKVLRANERKIITVQIIKLSN
ncbi:MAG: HlyC/CorC family transporter [Pelagibacteraceae bacterium]|jgi:CBS domain containing-hemolysin-like protein|nr:HlyC/CorC family transporter [Pelagibacteraceae bacterium]MBT3903174.1 HlyC/CorC family transporter [Pelagibacteraceae bacterium]MBT4950774.1 HlyC/CorC family transporter [Pelagibacteraceae bacterium]MBT5213288.1 HlyC/CorC family transporter [Pelagibacteraceae bacterium]